MSEFLFINIVFHGGDIINTFYLNECVYFALYSKTVVIVFHCVCEFDLPV